MGSTCIIVVLGVTSTHTTWSHYLYSASKLTKLLHCPAPPSSQLKYLNKNRIGLIPPPRSSSSLRKEPQREKMGEREEDLKKAKWPKIKPKKDLQINRLKDTHLFTVPNFFTSVESKGFVKVAELMRFAHQGSLGPTKGEAFRDNDRISVNDPVLAETIWESGLNKFFSDIRIRGRAAVGLNPNIRLYRYKVGQRFGRHIDESVDMGDGKRTYYTLLIYLSGGVRQKTKADVSSQKDSPVDSLVGGETVFYDSRRGVVAEVAPVEGMALLHLHGDKCMLHEARNVAKGVKYVFRSDVIFA